MLIFYSIISMNSYQDIQKQLSEEKKNEYAEGTTKLEVKGAEQRDAAITFFQKTDEQYQEGCKVKIVSNAVRVEQGEYAVLKRSEYSPPIGTHHVTPCVIICVQSQNYFGLAHFDSYRNPYDLESFFKPFEGEQTVQVQIFGGKQGSDPLRTGNENKTEVIKYVGSFLPKASIAVTPPPETGFLDLVFYPDGKIKEKEFCTGLGITETHGAKMRLVHNLGGIVTAQQSRSGQFIPLNFTEAYTGTKQPFLLDRLDMKLFHDFDPSPIKGEEQSWTLDPGGYLLGQEMKLGYQLIKEEISNQQKIMEKLISEFISDEELRKKIISASPIYIGEGAEEANVDIVKLLANIYETTDKESVYPEFLLQVNKLSPYPLVTDIIPEVAKLYQIKDEHLKQSLGDKFGNYSNLAYGVDITANDLASIIQSLIIKQRPGIYFIQQLKDNLQDENVKNTGDFMKHLGDIYSFNSKKMLTEICDEYNQELKKEENINAIIEALDEKNELSKGHVLQVLQSTYSPMYFKVISTKYFNDIWDEAKSPVAALEAVIFKFQPPSESDLKSEYLNLAKIFHLAHLKPLSPEDIQNMAFDDKIPGIAGVTAGILKKTIINVLGKNNEFQKDFEAEKIDSIALTKKLRDHMPYKKPLSESFSECKDSKISFYRI